MRCHSCDQHNPDDNRFCTNCGIELKRDESEEHEPRKDSSVAELERRMGRLEREFSVIKSLLDRRHLETAQVELTNVNRQDRATDESASVLVSQQNKPPTFGIGDRLKLRSIDWEQVLGLNWLAIIGAIALSVGVGFFLKLAFENNWIGPTGRIILGISIGTLLVCIGEYCQRRFPPWAQSMAGGGVGILYLSVYAAFAFVDVLDPMPALIFLALVVVLSGVLALRYESLTIAIISVFGAYLAPMLLDSGVHPDQYYILLAYILLVGLGVLGVSMFRNWRWLTLLGLLASYSLFGLYIDRVPDQDLIIAQIGLSGNFLIFVGATTLFHIAWRREPNPTDMTLMTLNAGAYFSVTYGLLWDQYQGWFGVMSLGLTIFYGLVGYGAIKRSKTSPKVALFSLGTAITFLTIAIPMQLTGFWITVAWIAQGTVLIWIGFMTKSWQTRAFALGVLGLSAFRLLILETMISYEDFQVVVNARFLIFSVSIVALYLASLLYRKNVDNVEHWEKNVSLMLFCIANFFTLWILSAEVIAYFGNKAILEDLHYATIDAQNGQILALTPLWAIYAVGLMAIALATGSRVLRWMGLVVLVAPVLKLVSVDTFAVDFIPETHTLIANFQFTSSVSVIAALIFAIFLYRRHRTDLLNAERYVFRVLLLVTNLVAIWVLSTEAIRFFDSLEIRENGNNADFSNGKYLTLTVLWTLYAIGIIVSGIVRRSSKLRLVGLVVLGIPILKLFIFDVFQLEQEYRVAAFSALGILLLATGLAYQWRRKAIKEFLIGDPS